LQTTESAYIFCPASARSKESIKMFSQDKGHGIS